jgi:hypothetical protein
MNNAFRKIVGWLSLELGAARIHRVTLRDVETLLMTDKTIEKDHLSKERGKKVFSSEFTQCRMGLNKRCVSPKTLLITVRNITASEGILKLNNACA